MGRNLQFPKVELSFQRMIVVPIRFGALELSRSYTDYGTIRWTVKLDPLFKN